MIGWANGRLGGPVFFRFAAAKSGHRSIHFILHESAGTHRMTDASDQAQPETPTMTQIIQVLQPQVERIEDAFRSIRVTLEALQDHLQK